MVVIADKLTPPIAGCIRTFSSPPNPVKLQAHLLIPRPLPLPGLHPNRHLPPNRVRLQLLHILRLNLHIPHRSQHEGECGERAGSVANCLMSFYMR